MWVAIDDRTLVSDKGEVVTTWHWTRHGTEVIRRKPLATRLNNRGLLVVGITGRGSVSVAQLVARTFVPNPDNLPYVGYLDGNRSNVDASNLYWTDKKKRG